MKNLNEISLHIENEIRNNEGLSFEANEVLDVLKSKIILLCLNYQILVEDFGVVYPYKNIRACICGPRGSNKELFILTKNSFDKCYEESSPKPFFVDSEFLESLLPPQGIIFIEGKDIR